MEELIAVAKALSDPNRVRIVALIAREGDVCVCELCDTLHLSQPLVSRHLRQLKSARIVESRKEGRWTRYRLAAEPSPALRCCIETVRNAAIDLEPLCRCTQS